MIKTGNKNKQTKKKKSDLIYDANHSFFYKFHDIKKLITFLLNQSILF